MKKQAYCFQLLKNLWRKQCALHQERKQLMMEILPKKGIHKGFLLFCLEFYKIYAGFVSIPA